MEHISSGFIMQKVSFFGKTHFYYDEWDDIIQIFYDQGGLLSWYNKQIRYANKYAFWFYTFYMQKCIEYNKLLGTMQCRMVTKNPMYTKDSILSLIYKSICSP